MTFEEIKQNLQNSSFSDLTLAELDNIKLNLEQKQALAKWIMESLERTALSPEEQNFYLQEDPTIKSMYDELETIKKEVASTLFENKGSYKGKDNKKILVSHNKISKNLTVDAHPEISLNDKKGKKKAVVCMDLLNYEGVELTKPLNYFDMAVLQAVYSLVDAGNDYFTDAQIYRKMRGGARKNPTKEALKEIDKTMLKLKSTLLYLECNDAEGKISEEAIKILGAKKTRESLIDFKSYGIKVNGQEGWGYILKGIKDPITNDIVFLPGFYRLIKKIGQYQRLDDEILNIKRLDNKTGKYKNVGMTSERITITKYLLDFVLTFNHANGNITPYRTYQQIFDACEVKIKYGADKQRAIEFIKIVLDHFKRNGLISHFEEYNNGRGVKIETQKKLT